MPEAKPYVIPKQLVWDAYQRVKANQGAAGVDGESLAAFEKDLKGNLYKVWNRMSSGSYFPPPVRLVEIPKDSGGTRPLGIPTVADRVAQTVVKMVLEPLVEPHFHPDSYGYRPGKSALDAVGVARKRCWGADWVIDLDIKAFFDPSRMTWSSVPWRTTPTAVGPAVHCAVASCPGATARRHPGAADEGHAARRSHQSVAGEPLPALRVRCWMRRTFPGVRFERYADDAIVHCRSERQARRCWKRSGIGSSSAVWSFIPTKTRIVYCKDDDRPGEHEHVSFDFLGYTFQPRRAKNRWGKFFVSFLPAISAKAAKAIRQTIREWRMASTRNNQRLEDLARLVNPAVRGWMNYYGRFYRSRCVQVLRHLNEALAAWVRRKYKRFRRRERASMHWLGRIARREPKLFVLWQLGLKPEAGG